MAMDLDGAPVGAPAQFIWQPSIEELRQADQALERTQRLIEEARELLDEVRDTLRPQ
jgi:type II secretory pathway component PulM